MKARLRTCPGSMGGVLVREKVMGDTAWRVVTKGAPEASARQSCTGVFCRTTSSR
jgi:hypothetical protein